MKKEIVSVEWLNDNLTNDNLVILDVSPASTAKGKNSSHQNLYIQHARVVNLKQTFTNTKSDFPNTVPSASQFEQACQSLGINKDSRIVVYDNLGIYTSPRAWWLFKTMGHEEVMVLNGGLTEWINKGYETFEKSALRQEYQIGNFESNFDKEYLITYNDIIENIESNKFLVVDARSEGRFKGIETEPRKHLKSGSIPNSINIPYGSLLENGKFKSVEQLRELFTQKTGNKDALVFSCGSGITACIVMLASEIAFKKSRFLYDGSWTEYAELKKLRFEL